MRAMLVVLTCESCCVSSISVIIIVYFIICYHMHCFLYLLYKPAIKCIPQMKKLRKTGGKHLTKVTLQMAQLESNIRALPV